MPDTMDDCMTLVANARRRMELVADYGKALRKAKDHDEAVSIHMAMMLEIGFVQSDHHKLEAWLRAAKACGLQGPQLLPVPAIRDDVAMAAVDQLRSQRHPELPLCMDRVDVRKLQAHDVDDEEVGS
jgi:hypothetical protein